MEEPLDARDVSKNNIRAQELPPSATNGGEKRKREGLFRSETENISKTKEVILVGDTKSLKCFGFGGGEHSQTQGSVFSKRRAFDEQSDINPQGTMVKEEACEEPEIAKHDSTFNDFDKLREESGFAVGQTWALYDDDIDGMPRLYAQITKVSVPGFGLCVTWLEPDPDDKEGIENHDKELPVSFGKFRLGKTESIKDRRRFSHVVQCSKGSSAGKFSIYPRKGETWAVFKGRCKGLCSWDVDWSPEPDSHSKYTYGFVKIVSEYDEGSSTRIGFLHKTKGFKSVFCRFTEETETCYIHSYGPYQFSHRVPSFKTTGTEAKGVPPRGAYELDPAALPKDIKEIDVPLHLLAEPKVSNSEDNTHTGCVYFANKGTTFQTGKIWSFRSGEDHLPRYYGKIEKITFIQALEQEPVVKLHISRLKATSIKGNIQWTDKNMPIGCGDFKARKVLEIFTDLDVFSHQISLDSSRNGNDYSIMPKTGDVWAIYRNWSKDIEVSGLQSQAYDLVEVLDDKLDYYKVMLLSPDGGVKVACSAGICSVYVAATEHWINGADVRFTIPRSELLRFSHQVPTLKVTREIPGALQEVYEPDTKALPVNLII
ncbi:unnamed protein product [Cochlearia groenlandica]